MPGRDLFANSAKRHMAIAKVIEINSGSDKSFDEAVENGIKKAGESVRDIRGAWVKDQQVLVKDGKITEYRVDLKVSFVLE
jgi:flavin-binding protein dodecin